MTARNLTSLLIIYVLTLATLAGLGLLIARFFAPPPLPRFITNTFDFVVPTTWSCDLDEAGADYACWRGKAPHEAIAIIALKRRGPEDNLAAYKEHLSRPKPDQNGTPSVIRSVERRSLAGYEWIEAVHVSSEIPNYVTIYLATVTSHVGVLATFSVQRDFEQSVLPEIDIMITSLNIHQDVSGAFDPT